MSFKEWGLEKETTFVFGQCRKNDCYLSLSWNKNKTPVSFIEPITFTVVFRFKHVQFKQVFWFKQDYCSSQHFTTLNVWFKQDFGGPFFDLSKKNSRFLATFALIFVRLG